MSEGDDSAGKGREVAIFAVAVAGEWGVGSGEGVR